MPSSLAGISALISIVGDKGTDIVVLQDTSDVTDRDFTLTSTGVITDALGAGGLIAYDSAIDNLDIQAGPGQNSYVVKGTAAAVETEIQADNSDNAFVVNGPITAPLAINGGAAAFGGQILTVNGDSSADNFVVGPNEITGAGAPIFYTNVQGVVINGTAGNNTFTLNGDTVPTTLMGGSGNDTFTVNGTSQPTFIDGGSGTDSFTLNGNGAPLTVSGEGNDSFTVNGNSSQTILNGGPGADSFTVNSNTNVLVLNGGSGSNASNTFDVLSNTGTLDINTNGGASAFNIANIVAPVNINGQNSGSTYTVSGPLEAPINVTGDSTLQTLIINATAGSDNITLTPTQILGLGFPITYSGLLSVIINGLGGDDTFTVLGNSAATVINAGVGNSTFNVQDISSPITLNTGTGASTINLGNPNGVLGSLLSSISADVTINGSGSDTLNVNDAADFLTEHGTLSATSISGAGLSGASVDYTGLSQINVALGSGADSFTVISTPPAAPVNIVGGSGADVVNVESTSSTVNVTTTSGANTINVGTLAPLTGGVLNKIQGALTITGSKSDTINLDDSGDINAQTGDLTATTFTGMGMGAAGITYSGASGLDLALGSGGNTILVENTNANTTTVITGGSGGDTYNIRTDGGLVAVNTGSGANTINVGTLAPATGGTLAGIQGGVSVAAGGTDTLNIDDSANAGNTAVSLAPTRVLGADLSSTGISYSGLTNLNVALGTGNLVVTVLGTPSNVATTLTTGNGNETINVLATGSGATTIQAGAGNNTLNVQSTGGPTTLSAGTGNSTINVGSLAPLAGGSLAGINGALTLAGGGTNIINLDDSTASSQTGTLSATTLTGFSPATITYGGDSGLVTLNLTLGSSGNTLTIANTAAAATTNVNTGAGSDTVTLQSTGGVTNLNTQGGNDTITVQATAAATTINTGTGTNTITVASSAPATLSGIQGALTIQGTAADTLTLDDSGSTIARVGTLSPTAVTGFGMIAAGVTYSRCLGTAEPSKLAPAAPRLGDFEHRRGHHDAHRRQHRQRQHHPRRRQRPDDHLTTSTSVNTIAIQTTGTSTTLTSGAGATNTITVGNSSSIDAITGALTIVGNGSDSLLIDDSASAASVTTATLTPNAAHRP